MRTDFGVFEPKKGTTFMALNSVDFNFFVRWS